MMATVFEAMDETLSVALSSVFAEPARLVPRVSSQYAVRASDPDRPEVAVTGVFSASAAQQGLDGQAGGFSGATRVTSTSVTFWIAKTQVDALTLAPAKGDALILTNRTGQPVYGISAVQHTDMGDITLILVREQDDT
jgi:hypothetical protein